MELATLPIWGDWPHPDSVMTKYKMDLINTAIRGLESSTLVNVKNPPFLAVGDGVTNDTASIQAAIDAVWNAGGGTVFFPSSTYRAQGIIQRAGVWLLGAGPGQDLAVLQARHATTIKCIDAPVVNVAVLYADPTITGSRYYGGGISDMAIWGPDDDVALRPTVAANQVKQVDGVSFATVPDGTWLTHWEMDNCRIYGLRRGIYLGGGSGVIRYVPIKGTYVSNCETGAVIESGHPKFTHSRFRYCDTAINASAEDWQFVDNAVGQCNWGIISTLAGGFYMERCAFVGNIFYGIQFTALDIGSGCMVMGNVFRGKGGLGDADGADPATVGPLINVRLRSNIILGNRFFGNHSGAAIKLSPTAASSQSSNIIAYNTVLIDLGRFIEIGDTGTLTALQIIGNAVTVTSAGDGAGGMFLYANMGILSSLMLKDNAIRVEINQTKPLVDVKVTSNGFGPMVEGNRVLTTANVPGVFYFTTATQTGGIICNNKFETSGGAYTATPISIATLTNTVIRDNLGYKTENSGTGTVANATTSIDVNHGLDITPLIHSISVTPTNNLGNAAKFWVSNVTATQFRINVNADPGAGTATFAWNISSHRLI